MKSISEIFAEHQGKLVDKWSLYINEMDHLFSKYRTKSINLLEIGIQNGGSLEIWSKYFPNAKHIVGCDIDPKCAELSFEDRRISVIVGDANLSEKQVFEIAGSYDVIIDDGSHKSGDILKSFSLYFESLNEGGSYIIEDLHCSYWSDFEGGLYDAYSSMSFLKRLADVINYEHWRFDKPPEFFLKDFCAKYNFNIETHVLEEIHSIEFMNSLCIIRKSSKENNKLGQRHVEGIEEIVTKNQKTTNTSLIEDITFNFEQNERDDVFNLKKDLLHQEQQISNLSQSLAEREAQISNLSNYLNDILKSMSWRVTKPLRASNKLFKIILKKLNYYE